MKKTTTKRIISMILAMALMISILPMNTFTVKAEENPAAVKALIEQADGKISDDETVTVIVQLKDEDVSAQTLKSVTGKKQKMNNSKEKQKDIKSKIKNKEINFKFGDEYTLLINGFSGKTTFAEAKKIANMPEVESVEIEVQYSAPEIVDEVKMTNSVDMVKARESWNLGFNGEGKLIAILDSGADPYHQDFKVTDVSKAKYPSAESMQNAMTSLGLPGKIFNDKVIYGYNYADKNQDIKEILQKSGMHGMHVAGTTAANGDVTKGGIKGVAPEAQLLIMRVFSEAGGGTGSSIYLKAIEDSVALGADSINMSLGSPAGTIKKVGAAVINAIQKAADIGCLVNIAAGNEGYFGQSWSNPLASAPDYGIVGSPSVAPLSISVASINNDYLQVSVLKLEDGTFVPYRMSGKLMPQYDVMYDVVDCGIGKPEDFAGKDVKGKLAIIERGVLSFADKLKNAADNGAVGVLMYNSEAGGENFIGMAIDGATIPGASLYRSEGLKLIAKPQKVSFTKEMKPVASTNAGTMSSFSNWGMSNDQDFKPELTAPGGNIYSTLNDNQYGDMSGTSMATPHVSGGVAVVNDRVTEDYPSVTGMDKYYLIKNLLLSTAIPHIDPDKKVFTSPRKQGAGVMNLAGATQSDTVVVDPETNISKINKKDVGNTFELSAKLINYGKEDATYTYSTTLQTDSVVDGYMELKPRLLKTIPGATVTVPAGSEVTVKVNVDASEFEGELSKLMPNGYYLEGFINFKSEKQSDLNIAYIGFHGKWNDIPVLEKSIYDFTDGSKPFYYTNTTTDFTHFYSKVDGQKTVLGYYPEEAVKYNKEKIVFSPNGDSKADEISFNGTFFRNYRDVQLLVSRIGSDKPFFKSYISASMGSGNKNHFSGDAKKWPKSSTLSSWTWNGKENYKAVEDGVYEMEVSVTPDIAEGTPQIQKYSIIVDTKAPSVRDVSFDSATGILKFTSVDITSGVRSEKVTLPDGTVVNKNADGTYTLPKDIDPSTVLVEISDYGYNTLKDSVTNIQIPNKDASITFRGETTDGSPLPTYKVVVKNEKGEIQLNPSKLAYGTYTVEATDIKSGYVCENATHTVTLTETAPSANIIFKFKELKIPMQELVVSLDIQGGTYPDTIEFVAKDSKGKEYLMPADSVISGWYTVKVPYETYEITIKNIAENWMITPEKYTITVNESYPEIIYMKLTYGAGGYISPVAKTEDGLDLSAIKFEAVDEYGSPVDINKKLANGVYTVYPLNLPTGSYSVPQYTDVEIKEGVAEVKPEFLIVDGKGVTGEIKINTILAKDTYTDVKPEYKVTDFYGNKVTDLTKVSMGTYYIKPINVPAAYMVTPEAQEVVIDKDNLNAEVSFVYTKLSDTGLKGTLYFWGTIPWEFRQTVNFEIIAEDGTVTNFEYDKNRPFNNKIDLNYGMYKIRALNIPEGFYIERPVMTVAVNSIFSNAEFTVKKGVRPVLNIKSFEKNEDITVPFGTALDSVKLPSTTVAVLEDGTKVTLPVTWDTSSFAANKAGEFTFKGNVDIADHPEISNKDNLSPEIKLVVKANEITGVEEVPYQRYGLNISIDKIKLPNEIEVKLSDGTTARLMVKWDLTSFDNKKLGTQTFHGEIILPEDGSIANSSKITAMANIELVKPLAVRVTTVIRVPYGTPSSEFTHPETTRVLMSDLTIREMKVTWELVSISKFGAVSMSKFGAAGAYYTYLGTIELPDDGTVVNPLNLKALYTVHVMHKNAKKINFGLPHMMN